MSVKVRVLTDIEIGIWRGMGGAITEATAYNFSKLSKKRQEALLDAYYGGSGLDYRWGRVSIGSNDFCLKPYEYTKKRDLSDFSIEHDSKYVLPLLKRILRRKKLCLIAAPWSPPSILKTTKCTRFGGRLRFWRYGDYAKYIRKWLIAYEHEGISFEYLSLQNEPFAAQEWESCCYSYWAQRRLAYRYLARELADMEVRFLLWDHNKAKLTEVAEHLLVRSKRGNGEKVAGLCYHWYDGSCADEMWRVRQEYPNIFMMSSEMCCGFSPYDENEWAEAVRLYLSELLQDINSGTGAWIDWNMLLSWSGGPSYCRNFVKSPVILNESEDDFILTPIYDALRKIAKVFPPGSKVVRCESESGDVVSICRKDGDGFVVVLANVADSMREVELSCGSGCRKLNLASGEIRKIVF